MQIVDLQVTAGEVVSWYGQARYFSLYKALGGVKVSTNTGVNSTFYQGIGGDITQGKNQLCTTINFVAEKTQTIQFAVSDILVTDNRVAGEVEVNGVVKVDTTAIHPAFIYASMNDQNFFLENPIGSGIEVHVTAIWHESATMNGEFFTMRRNGDATSAFDWNGGGYGPLQVEPIGISGSDASACYVGANRSSNTGYNFSGFVSGWHFVSLGTRDFEPSNPLVLHEGDAISMENFVENIELNAQWQEVAV